MAETLVKYPASYDTSSYQYQSIASGYALTNPVGKGSTSTSAARINLKTGSSAETWVYYKFDFSAIPEGSTINSVACRAKCMISTTTSNRVKTRTIQLYSGNTAKGNAYTLANSTTAFNITAGTWTRDELQSCRLKLYAQRGSSSTTTTYYIGFYGADITVQYTVPSGEQFMVRIDGSWKEVVGIYKKVNGVWVEQTHDQAKDQIKAGARIRRH